MLVIGPFYGPLAGLMLWVVDLFRHLLATTRPPGQRRAGWIGALMVVAVILALAALVIPSSVNWLAPDLGPHHASLARLLGPRVAIGLVLAFVAWRWPLPFSGHAPPAASHGRWQCLRNNLMVVLSLLLLYAAGSAVSSALGDDSRRSVGYLLSHMTAHLGTSVLFVTAMAMGATLPYYGGLAFAQHFVVRYRLKRQDLGPWRYGQFLEYAVSRGFLEYVEYADHAAGASPQARGADMPWRDDVEYKFAHPALRALFAARRSYRAQDAAPTTAEPRTTARPIGASAAARHA